MKRIDLQEIRKPGMRLGRHILHDPESWRFPAPMVSKVVSIFHKRLVPVFDQGDLGSCTGNAAAGAMCTEPFTNRFTEDDAKEFYSEGTHLDRIRGVYPPTDTGSSGLALAKVLLKRQLIAGYTHGFSLDAVLKALGLGPAITGINWLEGCDHPDKNGVVQYRGPSRGGHEIVIDEVDVPRKLLGFTNSWGTSYGLKGRFYMSWSDYGKALADHGDATFFTRRAA